MKLSMCVAALLVTAVVARAAEEGLASVDAAWAKAMKSNSVDQVVACYADDAVGWFPDTAEAKGAKAIRAGYESFLKGSTILDAGTSDTHFAKAGKLSVGWGKYSITVVDKTTGKTNVWSGRFTGVAEKRDGRWVYIVDHASAEPAPKP